MTTLFATLFGRLAPRRPPAPTLLDLIALQRQRRRLRELDPHLLRDMGLTAEDAEFEAARPVWDVPAYWRG